MTLYHSTKLNRVESILSKGILPHSEVLERGWSVNWGCSEDVVHFSIGRDAARVETTSVGTPIDRAVVIEVEVSRNEVEEYLGPTEEYYRGPEKESSVYIHSGRVLPKRFRKLHLYTDYRSDPTTFVLKENDR